MNNTKISWANSKLEVKKSNTGKGVFATKNIFKGEVVTVFGGYVLSIDGLNKIQKEKPRSYQAIMDVAYQIDDNLIFSPTYYNQFSYAEYLNHNCEPNCGFKNQLGLVAMRDIEKGEELTFDYAMSMTSNIFDMQCLCGRINCRKNITGNDWKDLKLQKKYKGHFQPYIQEKISMLKNKK